MQLCFKWVVCLRYVNEQIISKSSFKGIHGLNWFQGSRNCLEGQKEWQERKCEYSYGVGVLGVREHHQQVAYKYVTGAINGLLMPPHRSQHCYWPHPKVRNIPQSFPQISDGHFRTSTIPHFRILGIPDKFIGK